MEDIIRYLFNGLETLWHVNATSLAAFCDRTRISKNGLPPLPFRKHHRAFQVGTTYRIGEGALLCKNGSETRSEHLACGRILDAC